MTNTASRSKAKYLILFDDNANVPAENKAVMSTHATFEAAQRSLATTLRMQRRRAGMSTSGTFETIYQRNADGSLTLANGEVE